MMTSLHNNRPKEGSLMMKTYCDKENGCMFCDLLLCEGKKFQMPLPSRKFVLDQKGNIICLTLRNGKYIDSEGRIYEYGRQTEC